MSLLVYICDVSSFCEVVSVHSPEVAVNEGQRTLVGAGFGIEADQTNEIRSISGSEHFGSISGSDLHNCMVYKVFASQTIVLFTVRRSILIAKWAL